MTLVGLKTTFRSSWQYNGTDVSIEDVESVDPEVASATTEGLANFADQPHRVADSCIYCGNPALPRSKEHVIPYALGGDVQIIKGSCPTCQEKTQRFEGATLNGRMATVRYMRGIKSRSKHKSAERVTESRVLKNGQEIVLCLPTDQVPFLAAFPQFDLPSLLDESGQSRLRILGSQNAVFGPDVEEFLRAHRAQSLLGELHIKPIPFAQMVAKIAYCFAWHQGTLAFVKGSDGLVGAFMDQPELLGKFVGTKQGPIAHYPQLAFRIEYDWDARGVLVVEVQMFADIPLPTYLVVLGKASIRDWKKVRALLSVINRTDSLIYSPRSLS